MKSEDLPQVDCPDAADYFHKSDQKYGMANLQLAAVTQPQTADSAATSTPAAFPGPVETLDRIPGEAQML